MNKTVKIGEVDITFKRLPLQQWVELEEQKTEMREAAEKRDFHGVVSAMATCISAASDAKVDWTSKPWFEMIEAFGACASVNSPTKPFPILKGDGKKEEKLPWEYPGRNWYFWINLLGKAYGWSKEYIGALDIDDAIGLFQELTIDDQLQHEWEWMRDDIAYSYNPKTKQTTFKPLKRPAWMEKIVEKPKTLLIKKSLIPVGNVVMEFKDDRTEDTKPE